MTVPATKSALHRAREAMADRAVARDEEIDADLLARYVTAWETADPAAIEAIHVVGGRAQAIVAIDHFLMPDVFEVFGVPRSL